MSRIEMGYLHSTCQLSLKDKTPSNDLHSRHCVGKLPNQSESAPISQLAIKSLLLKNNRRVALFGGYLGWENIDGRLIFIFVLS